MKHRLLLLLLSLSISAFAQSSGSLQGTVIDSQSATPLEMVAVQLFRLPDNAAGDTLMIRGAQTDAQGFFYFTKVDPGHYRLVFSSLGYTTLNKDVRITAENMYPDLGQIRLSEDVLVLGEVDVKGHAAEMTVKGDTIEYNAAAYQMEETAVVEDLLKKLAGVQVDSEGNVTVNGETITAVRVDGKKFFGDDVQTATKNIPADMIESVQVLDEKSQSAQMTGFEDDETSRVINLTLKKDRKQGFFSNMGGGLGGDMVTDDDKWFNYGNPVFGATPWDKTKHFFQNDFRYNAQLFANIMSGESQTTVMGSANNTNEIRMGRGRGSWGSANQGITWAENIGVNTNIDFTDRITNPKPEEEMLFGGDGQFSHSSNYTYSSGEKTSYTSASDYLQSDSANANIALWDANVRLEYEYQIDSLNKILLQPRFSYTNQRGNEYNDYLYRTATATDTTIASNGDQIKGSASQNYTGELKAIYNHKFLHAGRKLTFTANAGFTHTNSASTTLAHNLIADTILVNQFTNSLARNINYSLKTSYIEPLGSTKHLLEIAIELSGTNRASRKDQYDISGAAGVLDTTYNTEYSNSLNNDIYTEQLELNYQYKHDKLNLTAGLKGLATQTHSRTFYGGVLLRDTLRNVFNFAPNINLKYNFGKKEFARLRYRGTTTQPTITQMEPVRNNSDAMNETVGNLSLNPAFRHMLFLMYSRFNQDNFSSLMTGMRATLTKDALVSNSIYDETGKLYSQTVNAGDLPYDISADLMYNTPFANKLMQFHTRTNIGYNMRVGYISRSHTAAEIAAMIEQDALVLGDKSLTGNFTVGEELMVRLSHDIVNIGVTGEVNYSRTNNSLSNQKTNVINWTITGDVQFNLPRSWTITADCGYTARYGYQLSDVNEILLNAGIMKTWGNGTLSLKAYDLLHQKKNIVQIVGDNYVQYKKYNTLPTYIMLSFTYKLNRMGDLKAKGMAGHIQSMMESGSPAGQPGGGMPPGPPPGQ